MSRSRPPKLIEEFIGLKWAELNAFAAMLRPSVRSAAPVGTIEWVTRLGELATLHNLAGCLENVYRRQTGADSVPQRVRCAR